MVRRGGEWEAGFACRAAVGLPVGGRGCLQGCSGSSASFRRSRRFGPWVPVPSGSPRLAAAPADQGAAAGGVRRRQEPTPDAAARLGARPPPPPPPPPSSAAGLLGGGVPRCAACAEEIPWTIVGRSVPLPTQEAGRSKLASPIRVARRCNLPSLRFAHSTVLRLAHSAVSACSVEVMDP